MQLRFLLERCVHEMKRSRTLHQSAVEDIRKFQNYCVDNMEKVPVEFPETKQRWWEGVIVSWDMVFTNDDETEEALAAELLFEDDTRQDMEWYYIAANLSDKRMGKRLEQLVGEESKYAKRKKKAEKNIEKIKVKFKEVEEAIRCRDQKQFNAVRAMFNSRNTGDSTSCKRIRVAPNSPSSSSVAKRTKMDLPTDSYRDESTVGIMTPVHVTTHTTVVTPCTKSIASPATPQLEVLTLPSSATLESSQPSGSRNNIRIPRKAISDVPSKTTEEQPDLRGSPHDTPKSPQETVRCLDPQLFLDKVEPYILCKDENMMVIYKPPNWHCTRQQLIQRCLIDMASELSDRGRTSNLRNYMFTVEDMRYKGHVKDGQIQEGCVQRLDRDTSGCLLIGQDDCEFLGLRRLMMTTRDIQKDYFALVHGVFKDPLVMSARVLTESEFSSVHSCVNPEGAPAGTLAIPLAYFTHKLLEDRSYTLVRSIIVTERIHQIRIHLASEGHPLVNDRHYSCGRQEEDATWCARNFLHQARISFERRGPHVVESPLPLDLVAALTNLRLDHVCRSEYIGDCGELGARLAGLCAVVSTKEQANSVRLDMSLVTANDDSALQSTLDNLSQKVMADYMDDEDYVKGSGQDDDSPNSRPVPPCKRMPDTLLTRRLERFFEYYPRLKSYEAPFRDIIKKLNRLENDWAITIDYMLTAYNTFESYRKYREGPERNLLGDFSLLIEELNEKMRRKQEELLMPPSRRVVTEMPIIPKHYHLQQRKEGGNSVTSPTEQS